MAGQGHDLGEMNFTLVFIVFVVPTSASALQRRQAGGKRGSDLRAAGEQPGGL